MKQLSLLLLGLSGVLANHLPNCNNNADLCGTHGTCVPYFGAIACVCDPGYLGEQCDYQVFSTDLNGANERPPTNSPYTGMAQLFVHYMPSVDKMALMIDHDPIPNLSMAHIHEGPISATGPVRVPLTVNGQQVEDVAPTDLTLSPTTLMNQGYYVNLHSSTFPSGEIRGQLSLMDPCSSVSCGGTNGFCSVPMPMASMSPTCVCQSGFTGPDCSTALTGTFCSGQSYGTATFGDTPAGSFAMGTCLFGYEGAPKRACQSDGTWSTLVTDLCTRSTCPMETFGNAMWPTTNSGNTALGRCEAGFSGRPSRKCGRDGLWEPVQSPCLPNSNCPVENYANALFPETAPTNQVRGSCVAGYSGSPFRTCMAGGIWGSLVINHCTRNVCPGETFGGAVWPNTKSLDIVIGTCLPGTSGTVRRTCLASGDWDNTITGNCLVAGNCPAVADYAHASYASTAPGTFATGTCLQGFTGRPQRLCQADGTWRSFIVNHCQRV